MPYAYIKHYMYYVQCTHISLPYRTKLGTIKNITPTVLALQQFSTFRLSSEPRAHHPFIVRVNSIRSTRISRLGLVHSQLYYKCYDYVLMRTRLNISHNFVLDPPPPYTHTPGYILMCIQTDINIRTCRFTYIYIYLYNMIIF